MQRFKLPLRQFCWVFQTAVHCLLCTMDASFLKISSNRSVFWQITWLTQIQRSTVGRTRLVSVFFCCFTAAFCWSLLLTTTLSKVFFFALLRKSNAISWRNYIRILRNCGQTHDCILLCFVIFYYHHSFKRYAEFWKPFFKDFYIWSHSKQPHTVLFYIDIAWRFLVPNGFYIKLSCLFSFCKHFNFKTLSPIGLQQCRNFIAPADFLTAWGSDYMFFTKTVYKILILIVENRLQDFKSDFVEMFFGQLSTKLIQRIL